MKKSRNLEKKQRLQPPVKSYEIAASCSPCWRKDYSSRQSFKMGTDLRLLVDTGPTLTAISWELNKTLEKDLRNKFKPDDGYELTADNGWSLQVNVMTYSSYNARSLPYWEKGWTSKQF